MLQSGPKNRDFFMSVAREQNASRMQNASFRENAMFLRCHGKLYCLRNTIVLRKIDLCSCKKAARSWQRQLEKTAGGLYCVYRLKGNRIQTGSF